MKILIFERIEWLDGGPNDKGIVTGYFFGESEKQLKKKFKITDGYTSFREISMETYYERKKQAKNTLKLFNLIF